MTMPEYRYEIIIYWSEPDQAFVVSGNWRVTFRFKGPDVTDVDYEDYH